MIVREPVGPVQVQPPGLINWLQLKVGGFTPGAFSLAIPAGPYDDIVSPVSVAGLQPEPGSRAWWYVHRWTIRAAAAVADGVFLQMAIREPGGARGALANDSFFTLGTFYPRLTAGETTFFSAENFWLPPGAQVGVYVGAVGIGGTLTLDLMGASYSELPL